MEPEGPVIKINSGVFLARGQRVATAEAAAAFYEVSMGALMRAVARNPRKLTREHMFRLTRREMTAVPEFRKLKKPPLVFTETGVSMLSAVLGSAKAAEVNVEIIREVIRLMKMLTGEQAI